jgi:hypothetical protein
VGLKLDYIEGQTPIDEDEKQGRSDLSKNNQIRKSYLDAVHEADNGDYRSLILFARS